MPEITKLKLLTEAMCVLSDYQLDENQSVNLYEWQGMFCFANQYLLHHVLVFLKHGWTLRYHAKWNKSDWERQIPYDVTYMWNLTTIKNK